MNKLAATKTQPIVTCECDVMSVTPLTTDTVEIELQWPAGTTPSYRAGQYLQLELDINGDGQRQTLPYSIANRFDPEQPRRLQLFIYQGSERAVRIVNHLAERSERRIQVQVTLAMGNAFLQTDLSLPHLLIAAGSGISKIKCLTEDILKQNPYADVRLYWSNKNADDFYLLDRFQCWSKQHENMHFTPILETAHADWSGRSGVIYRVIQEDAQEQNLDLTQAYLCGSPQMVYGTIDKLGAIGLKEESCFSDVFEYAPRGAKVAVNTRR